MCQALWLVLGYKDQWLRAAQSQEERKDNTTYGTQSEMMTAAVKTDRPTRVHERIPHIEADSGKLLSEKSPRT